MSKASVIVCTDKSSVAVHLNTAIRLYADQAIASRDVFTIALSGGSLPSFLSGIQDIPGDARFDRWHVILADERCVPLDDADSNLGALKTSFLSKVSIPESQIYGIDQSKLTDPTDEMAKDYDATVRRVLDLSGGLDLAVLGFGPDGHTCSLFPGHPLLGEYQRWVAGIDDSPKPPSKRITLTLAVLIENTRNGIFCGTGDSKSPILQKVFASVGPSDSDYNVEGGTSYALSITQPPPFPCAMVMPSLQGEDCQLIWIVDEDAMAGVSRL